PVGTDQFVEGGHGSAFDRVGAFEEGFTKGAKRCSELLDDPLPLMPNQFQSQQDFQREGNASYDCSDDSNPDCTPAPQFLSEDLNNFWQTELGDQYPTLTETPTDNVDSFSCSDGVRLADDVLLCPSQNAVVYNEPDVLDLYHRFGDFTLGYFYGIAWSERAQEVLDIDIQGEQRALLDDCYTGAWVRDITPDDLGHTPRE